MHNTNFSRLVLLKPHSLPLQNMRVNFKLIKQIYSWWYRILNQWKRTRHENSQFNIKWNGYCGNDFANELLRFITDEAHIYLIVHNIYKYYLLVSCECYYFHACYKAQVNRFLYIVSKQQYNISDTESKQLLENKHNISPLNICLNCHSFPCVSLAINSGVGNSEFVGSYSDRRAIIVSDNKYRKLALNTYVYS